MLNAKYWNASKVSMCPNADDSEGITLESLGKTSVMYIGTTWAIRGMNTAAGLPLFSIVLQKNYIIFHTSIQSRFWWGGWVGYIPEAPEI